MFWLWTKSCELYPVKINFALLSLKGWISPNSALNTLVLALYISVFTSYVFHAYRYCLESLDYEIKTIILLIFTFHSIFPLILMSWLHDTCWYWFALEFTWTTPCNTINFKHTLNGTNPRKKRKNFILRKRRQIPVIIPSNNIPGYILLLIIFQ